MPPPPKPAPRSTDLRGKSVYHTNVMMAIGSGVAIVCADSVQDAKERQHLLVGGWVGQSPLGGVGWGGVAGLGLGVFEK